MSLSVDLKKLELKFTNIYNLVPPNSKFKKGNINIYSIENILKKFAEIPNKYNIKSIIKSDVNLTVRAMESEIHHSLPSIVMSPFQALSIENINNNNGAYSIGPYIEYVQTALSLNELNIEKKILGKNLLVFRSHSLAGSEKLHDENLFCRKIEEIATKYDTVRVCLFEKDVLSGVAGIYIKHGFEVVTPGKCDDSMFMSRLKSIIQTSTMTVSRGLGTHVGYCIYMNKPHYIIKSEKSEKKELKDLGINTDNEDGAESQNYQELIKIIDLLSFNQEFISEELYSLMNKYWGFDQIKTQEKLKKLILEIEGLYQINNKNSKENQIKKLKRDIKEKNSFISQTIPFKKYIAYKIKNQKKI
ncbi:MAG: hypothetical protein LBU40_04050 [Methanobrevibacter sp.]|jgi:hypothetical protein|nr:hypothetical protein [Methanobrevibacter sp.]